MPMVTMTLTNKVGILTHFALNHNYTTTEVDSDTTRML